MGLFSFRVRPDRGRISARVITDSINPNGERLTTVEVTLNRYILAELNTHRILSKNSASSRAIPVKQIMRQVWSNPALPVSWGANQAGMQARSELSGWRRRFARRLFLLARIPALIVAWLMTRVGLHKQVVNRILEPWVWHTAVVSGTEWENFFKLRLHPDAQPEFQELARCIKVAMDDSKPKNIPWGGWHLPYVDGPITYDHACASVIHSPEHNPAWAQRVAKVAVACCARVSYVRQNDRRSEQEDIAFTERLAGSGHWSPFEHVAQAKIGHFGNFFGWKQLRSFYKECGVDESDKTVPRVRG